MALLIGLLLLTSQVHGATSHPLLKLTASDVSTTTVSFFYQLMKELFLYNLDECVIYTYQVALHVYNSFYSFGGGSFENGME